MPDIGFWELLLIAIVALVVVGPERLPKLVRVTGLWMGRATASLQAIRTEISRELRAEELKQALNKTVDLDELISMGSDSIDSEPTKGEAEKSLSEESIKPDPIEKEKP